MLPYNRSYTESGVKPDEYIKLCYLEYKCAVPRPAGSDACLEMIDQLFQRISYPELADIPIQDYGIASSLWGRLSRNRINRDVAEFRAIRAEIELAFLMALVLHDCHGQIWLALFWERFIVECDVKLGAQALKLFRDKLFQAFPAHIGKCPVLVLV
jgi:hypothetical protein